MTNGVGFVFIPKFCYTLIYEGKGAPWSGLYCKIKQSHKLNYNTWGYISEKEGTTGIILLESLIRWQDE